MRYLVFIITLFAAVQTNAQNNIVYGAGINYTNGAPIFTPPVRTSRVAIDTVTGRWYHFNTPGGWQWIGNTVEEIAGCAAPAYTPSKGDSRLVINNCVKPQVFWHDGAAWIWINEGTTYFPGEGIRIENDTIILDSLNFLDFRTGNALDGDVGRVQWNDTDGTLDLNLKGGNVTLQIGQEEVSLVKHADNSGLIEGRVVYIVGSDGANKTVRYAKADSDATSATTFGLMTESATGGNKAFCTTFGLVRNLNTTNLTEGGIVWLSADTAGTMTAVRPTAPDHGVMIGFCVRKHATQGAIFVQVQNGYELNELHDVFVPSPTNGQVLTWNSTNARWEAITPANQLQTLSTDNTPGNISISSGNTITLNVNDADASATNELQTLSVAANTATLSNSGGSVTIAGAGINTVGTAGTTITVTGTEVDGSTTNELQILSTGTNTLTLSNGGGTVTVDTDPSTDVTGSGTSGQVSFWTGAQTQSGDNALFWNNTDKRLGIGLTAPAARLHVVGSGTSSSTWTAQFHNSAGNNNALMIRDDGNVGIGTNAPGVKFEIRGNTSDNLANSFRVTNNNTQSLFDVRNDGQVTLGFGNSWFNYVDGVFTPNPLGRLLSLRFSASGATGTGYGLLIANGYVVNRDFTTGSGGGLRLAEGFAPASGTGIYNAIQIDGVINQTGGANGVTRGLNIDHNLTSASNYRAIEWSNSSGFGLYGSGTAPNLLNGRLSIPSGTYDLPALSFVGDANTGIFRPVEDNIEIKTGTNNAIVLENQATNLKTNSENLTLSSPLNQNITVTVPGTITAPDGTLTANLAVPNTTLNQHRFGFLINMTTPSTISIYAKAAGYNFLSMGEGGSVSGENIIFNLSNGTFSGSSTNYTAQMESVGNGWYRCILTNTTTGAAPNLYRFIIVRNANNTAAYTGDGTSGVYLWGFQAEESGSATSYIKTGSSTFLRPQAVSVLGPNLYGTLITKTLAAPSMQDLYFSTQNTTRLTVASSGSVGIGTTTPNASAAFEVASTTQGVLFPRMTTTERNAIAAPADGLVIYNTTDNKLQVRAAGAWVDLH